ncbi:MAG: hypothetical protein V7K40_26350 [Nostoc sp.]|uniref:hypothetical protein n=1 Tax=Nostoc sp. TaxID=1180 RepID=UPI002FF5503E
MTISLFWGNTRRSLLSRSAKPFPKGRITDSYAKATVRILCYVTTKEIYFEADTNQSPIAIKQSREEFTRDFVEILNQLYTQATSSENLRFYQQTPLQLVQSKKMSALGNLVAEVANKINNPVGFIAGNLQPAAYEVFHVAS